MTCTCLASCIREKKQSSKCGLSSLTEADVVGETPTDIEAVPRYRRQVLNAASSGDLLDCVDSIDRLQLFLSSHKSVHDPDEAITNRFALGNSNPDLVQPVVIEIEMILCNLLPSRRIITDVIAQKDIFVHKCADLNVLISFRAVDQRKFLYLSQLI